MLTAVVTTSHSGAVRVALVEGVVTADEEGEEGEEFICERIDKDPPELQTDAAECPELNPIAPELKEVAWGFGAFIIFALVLRFALYPKVRQGMQARYDSIQDDKESADTMTASARADVAEYEARLASVRAEAQQKIDAARATLEAERGEKLAEANARIAEKRAAAAADVEAARQAAMGDVESAVTDVVTTATEIATGRSADNGTVQNAVRSAMGAEVTS